MKAASSSTRHQPRRFTTSAGSVPHHRHGFVLILVLALLFASTLLLARMATHSIRLKSEAAIAVESLQQDWATWSTAHVMLPKGETLLTEMISDPGRSADSDDSATSRHILRIPGRTLNATIFDLDARLNLNTLHEIGGEMVVRNAIRRWIPDLEADVRSIDPDSKTALHYTSWADVISMNDTADDRSIADVFESACSGLTCWGSGKLNLHRCGDEQLLYLGKTLGRTSIMRQIIQELRKSPTASIESLCQILELRDEDAVIVKRYLDDSSGCTGLIIRCDDGGPELFLVKVAGSGAYRSRTLYFRLR